MTWVDGINLGASVASILLALVAMAMSLYFYCQTKNSEAKVENALEGIKAQTEALQRLSGRYLDRLTKYVTTPKEGPNAESTAVVQALDRLPAQIQTAVSILIAPSVGQQDALVKEIINCYIALLYYVGLTNVWSSFTLPSAENFDETDSWHQQIKTVVDRSYHDFMHIENLVFALDKQKLQSSDLVHLLGEIGNVYRPLIRDTAAVFSLRAKGEMPSND